MSAPKTQGEWLAELGAACDELGYGVERLESKSVTLRPRRPGIHGDTAIEIESVSLSGDFLRLLLRPLDPKP